MKLEEILPEIRRGRRFRRSGWFPVADFCSIEELSYQRGDHLLQEDWELEPEKPKTATIRREDLASAFKLEVFPYLHDKFVEVNVFGRLCDRIGL